MPDNKIIKHIKGRIKALLELYGNSMCSSKDHFRSTSTEINNFKNGRWNETISIVRYIEAYIGTCPLLSPPPPPPAKYYYGISTFEDCRAVFFSETSQVGYCNNFFQKFLEIGL